MYIALEKYFFSTIAIILYFYYLIKHSNDKQNGIISINNHKI